MKMTTARTASFGPYSVDLRSGELRKFETRLKMGEQTFQILRVLLEAQGELVTREELRAELWTDDTFVDFDHGLNSAIQRLRDCLSDSAEKPRWIETVPRRGYRFVGQVEWSEKAIANGGPREIPQEEAAVSATPQVASEHGQKTGEATTPPTISLFRYWRTAPFASLIPLAVGSLAAALALILVILGLNALGVRDRLWPPTAKSHIESLAVLPLENLSGDPSQDYYADGMTDELITALAKNSTLRVVSRTSAMQYKGAKQPLREIARALGVDGILEGSVNRSANHMHINLQLIYAPTDSDVWAQSYDRDLNGALSLPLEISQVIAAEAKVPSALPKPQRYVSPEAHDAYLQGRDYWFSGNYERSKEYFEKAIRLQPDYALAWDGLADYYGASAVEGRTPAREAFEKEEQYARKALSLDNFLPEAHNSIAAFYFFSARDWHKAEAESLRAIELNPNYAEGRHVHSFILFVLNRDEEAIQEQKRSSELDPFARPGALGRAYFWARRYDDAINELRVHSEIQPRDIGVQFFLFEAYWFKGMNKEAIQSLQQLFSAEGDKDLEAAVQRELQRGAEPVVGALFLRQDQDRARKEHLTSIHFAFDYALLQRKDDTIAALEEDYREHDPWLVFLQKDPAFDFLHNDPRYVALLKKIGLPQNN
jgi:TolB-like protein/DNA-binding winged helix-turn-helix (wHTH) protein